MSFALLLNNWAVRPAAAGVPARLLRCPGHAERSPSAQPFALHPLAAPPARRCGATRGPATHAVAAEYTLPRHREATADEKKRSAVIYGEALRQALAQPAPPPPRAARR